MIPRGYHITQLDPQVTPTDTTTRARAAAAVRAMCPDDADLMLEALGL